MSNILELFIFGILLLCFHVGPAGFELDVMAAMPVDAAKPPPSVAIYVGGRLQPAAPADHASRVPAVDPKFNAAMAVAADRTEEDFMDGSYNGFESEDSFDHEQWNDNNSGDPTYVPRMPWIFNKFKSMLRNNTNPLCVRALSSMNFHTTVPVPSSKKKKG